jgi:cyclic beta-1,2-glucan synthetase
MTFKYHSARYEIVVENPHGVSRGVGRMELDCEALTTGITRIVLNDDGVIHRIRILLGP